MIYITQHDARYLALRNCYEHRDAIKMLADYPDVRWHAESKAWLVDSRLWDDLALAVGKWLTGTPDFWCTFSIYAPTPAAPKRRTKQQIMAEKREQQAAASRFGRAIVEQMHKER